MLEIDKKNGSVAFNDQSHTYFNLEDDSIKYVSVTTMIEKFGQPFDKEFWSAYKALEKLLTKDEWTIEKKSLLNTKKFDNAILEAHNIDIDTFNKEQQVILDNWQEENKRSCERGTKIHANLENSMYKKKKNIDLTKFQVGGKFECIKDKTELDLENGVYPEYLISWDSPSGKLHVAGQIDLIAKQGNCITILDWKTNKKIDTKGFFDSKTRKSEKMKFPLGSLDECNYNHYCLQLSTYAYMLTQRHPEFIIDDLVLVHFDHNDNMTVYHLPYLRDEVIRMLNYYEKQVVLDTRKAKNKPIEY